MRKILAVCVICAGLTGCSGGSAESMVENMPQECKEMVQVSQEFIDKLKNTAEIPQYYIRFEAHFLDDFLKKLAHEPEERQASLCIPHHGIKQGQLRELQNERQALLERIEKQRSSGRFSDFE